MPDTTPEYSHEQRIAWLRDHTRRNPVTGKVEIYSRPTPASYMVWHHVDKQSVLEFCHNEIGCTIPDEQLLREIAWATDPFNAYTVEERLAWLRKHIRRRRGQITIEMRDIKHDEWVGLSDEVLNKVYPSYVRGNLPPEEIGPEFLSVLESIAPGSGANMILAMLTTQVTNPGIYDDSQRLAWLQDHTRLCPRTGTLEMRHIVLGVWDVVQPETLHTIYPWQVRGAVPDAQAWSEITRAAILEPSYEGTEPPVPDYQQDDVPLWAWQNRRRRFADGQVTPEIRNIIDGRWYPCADRTWSPYIPAAFRYRCSVGSLLRNINWGTRDIYGLPKTLSASVNLSAYEISSDLLFGGVDAYKNSPVSGAISEAQAGAMRMERIQRLDSVALQDWLGRDGTADVTMAKIAAALFGHEVALKPAEQACLAGRLKELGWVQRRTAAARLWCPPIVST